MKKDQSSSKCPQFSQKITANDLNDTQILYQVFLMGRFTLFHAGDLNNAPKWRLIVHRICCCSLIILFTMTYVWYLYEIISGLTKSKLSNILLFIMNFAKVSAYSFVTYIFYSSGFKIKLTKTVKDHFSKVEEVANKLNLAFKQIGLPRRYMTLFKYYMALTLIIPVYAIVSYLKDFSKLNLLLYSHFPEYFVSFYLSYITYLLKGLTRYIENRYIYLIENTEYLFLDKKLPENLIFWKIKYMEQLVRYLYHLRGALQDTFGWYIFFSVICAVLVTLDSISFALCCHIYNIKLDVNDLIHILIKPLVILVPNIVIVLAFDKLQNTSKKLSTVAFLAKKNTKNERILDELSFFSTFAEELTPSFKAGYFRVDRKLLTSCLSTIGTYLIVIIQFDLKSHQEIEQS